MKQPVRRGERISPSTGRPIGNTDHQAGRAESAAGSNPTLRAARFRFPALRFPRPACGILLLAACFPALSGCSTTVVRRGVERRVERRLADLLGPAEKYQVRIRGSRDPDLVRGVARRVEVEGRRIYAQEQLRIERLTLLIEDLRYTGGEPYFISVGRTDLLVEITEAAVNEYLHTYQARYNPEVRFRPEQVEVRMTYKFLGAPTPLRALGRFVIEDGQRLNFVASEADVPFINADQPEFRRRFVEDRVNPLLDLRRIQFPARLRSVELLPGRLRARGTAELPSEVNNEG